MKHVLIIFLCLPLLTNSQDDLLDEIDSDSIGDQYATAAFKGLKNRKF